MNPNSTSPLTHGHHLSLVNPSFEKTRLPIAGCYMALERGGSYKGCADTEGVLSLIETSDSGGGG